MYISKEPFQELGFAQVPHTPMPKLTESLQHTLFSYLWSPILLFGVLGWVLRATKPDQQSQEEQHGGKQ
ncbi:MAG: 4Fe-4S ferredoxin, partial [Desulfohalobiaceae bacterium]